MDTVTGFAGLPDSDATNAIARAAMQQASEAPIPSGGNDELSLLRSENELLRQQLAQMQEQLAQIQSQMPTSTMAQTSDYILPRTDLSQNVISSGVPIQQAVMQREVDIDMSKVDPTVVEKYAEMNNVAQKLSVGMANRENAAGFGGNGGLAFIGKMANDAGERAYAMFNQNFTENEMAVLAKYGSDSDTYRYVAQQNAAMKEMLGLDTVENKINASRFETMLPTTSVATDAATGYDHDVDV